MAPVLASKTEHNQAVVVFRRVRPNIRKIEIERDECPLLPLADRRDILIRMPSQRLLTNRVRVVAGLTQNGRRLLGQVLQTADDDAPGRAAAAHAVAPRFSSSNCSLARATSSAPRSMQAAYPPNSWPMVIGTAS